jgi:hypothetical protein
MLATKSYVDCISWQRNSCYRISKSSKSSRWTNIWFDTTTRHLSIYSTDAADWIVIATFEDTADLRQHIHDTSIGGNGLIVSIYQDAGYYDSIFSSSQDAGYYDLNEWAMEWNGGIAIDNFN